MVKPVFGLKILQFVVAVFYLLFTFSCVTQGDEFAEQRRQLRKNNPVNITQEDPVNYYYQEPSSRTGYAPQQYGVPAPVYYQPVTPTYVPVPASRFYSNPYAIPAAPTGYQRYDMDQYYVPPTRYRNIERQQPSVNIHHDDGADVKG